MISGDPFVINVFLDITLILTFQTKHAFHVAWENIATFRELQNVIHVLLENTVVLEGNLFA
jgi:hypothetical protein